MENDLDRAFQRGLEWLRNRPLEREEANAERHKSLTSRVNPPACYRGRGFGSSSEKWGAIWDLVGSVQGKVRRRPHEPTDKVKPPEAVIAALQSKEFPFQTAVAHEIQLEGLATDWKRDKT